jgi:Tfp pilus assembly protein PilO
MKKLLEKINKIDLAHKFGLDKQKIALVIIISLLLLYADLNFILKAQRSGLSKSSAEVSKLKNDLGLLDAGLKNMEEVRAKQKVAPKSKAKKIIFESQLASLLQDISKIGKANNVKILQIKPSRDPAKASPAQASSSPVLISMDLICGYHNFGKFVNELENNQAFMSVEGFKIEPQAEDDLKQKITLALKTYVKK